MEIDYNTLADLELLPSNGNSGALFQVLDRTATVGGRAILWEYLQAPLRVTSKIEERQRILKQLISHLPTLDVRELASVIHQVERYIASPSLSLPASVIQRAMLQLRYSNMVEEITRGIHALGELLEISQSIGDCLESFPVELTEIHSIAAAIRECIELPEHIKLRSVHRANSSSQSHLARFDNAIRDNSSVLAHIRNCIAALHHFDALRSLAIVSSQPGWSFPEMVKSDRPVFEAEELVHPLVANAISNSIAIGGPARLLYLTGPNMAGKTTFIKSCATAVLLSHTGCAVPAAKLRLSSYDRLYAALTIRDSIIRSESFFLAEVRRAKALVEYVAKGQHVFAIIDEMFKGTNILDASEATRLIVTGLATSQKSLFIIASHITDSVETFKEEEGIQLACFEGTIEQSGSLFFSYQIKSGVSTQRLGLALLKQENVLSLLDGLNENKESRG